jgi:hypothetical protein
MPPHASAAVRADDHDRRLSALERELAAIAGKQAAHEEICGVRYQGLDDKVTSLAGKVEQQTKTLGEIKEVLSGITGGRKMLLGLATLIGVPLLGFLGSLLSGIWNKVP